MTTADDHEWWRNQYGDLLAKREAQILRARERVNEIAVDYGHLVDHGLGAELDEVLAILDDDAPASRPAPDKPKVQE